MKMTVLTPDLPHNFPGSGRSVVSTRVAGAARQETWNHRVRDMFDAVIRAAEIDPAPAMSIDPT